MYPVALAPGMKFCYTGAGAQGHIGRGSSGNIRGNDSTIGLDVTVSRICQNATRSHWGHVKNTHFPNRCDEWRISVHRYIFQVA